MRTPASLPADPGALFDLMAARLSSSVVSDALDGLGYRDHTLDPALRPLDGAPVLVGHARTVRVAEVEEFPPVPYRGEIAALDSLDPGDVLVAAAQGSTRAALWGELFSTAARARGARGAVLDGYARDRRKIRELGFPVFCRGTLPLDCHGRTAMGAVDDGPVVCDGVTIQPGDVVVADEDGVAVVPLALLAEVAQRAFAKALGEDAARAALREGALLGQAWARYGVL